MQDTQDHSSKTAMIFSRFQKLGNVKRRNSRHFCKVERVRYVFLCYSSYLGKDKYVGKATRRVPDFYLGDIAIFCFCYTHGSQTPYLKCSLSFIAHSIGSFSDMISSAILDQNCPTFLTVALIPFMSD